MYHLGWISYDIYTKFEGDNNGDPVYFSKLTNWTFILLLLSNFIDAVTTLFAHCRTDISCDNQGETIKTPWYLKLSWLFFEMQNTAALLITILFYSLLTPNFTPLSIQYHAINSVYVILNFFVCAKPVRILHFVYPSIYGIIYSVFSVVDQLVLGNPPAYSFIDWTKPETAVIYCVVLVFVGVPIIHVTFFGLYKLRTFIKEKCEGSNRISSKQNYNISVRYYFANHDEETSDTTLHIFVDASQKAYGASVYLSKGTESTLVIAKNRVAPLKLITLPKLELMAAVIGARLSKDVIENLGVKRAVFWSDSQIVLHWLTSSKSFYKFVKNRVSEIKELTETHEWKYVPTEMNPADLQTRGLTASQFEDSTLWMNGPQWLTDECKWPTWTGHVEISTQLSNITGPKTHRSDDKVPSDPQRISQIIDMNRYSDLNRLLTVTGYVLKFVKNCQKKRPYRLRSSQGDRNLRTSLTEEEISLAMNLWIKDTQQTGS
ncbi:unnamed protein product [Mytilus edulis]|uniref:Uncharacterized protein n=1 Tax=Mytilus edulis TaxID=6550 RepID=A0A8S3RB57_MYTED|nr:unnamed protein product [Mytilus edulis]